MSWKIVIDGEQVEQTFASEAEACQHAANVRGQDWSMKIDVIDEGGLKRAEPQSPAPAQPTVLTQPAQPSRK